MSQIIPDLPIVDNNVSLVDIRHFTNPKERKRFARYGKNSVSFTVYCQPTILMIPYRITIKSNIAYSCVKDLCNRKTIGMFPVTPVVGTLRITASVPEDNINIVKEVVTDRLVFSVEDNVWYFNGVDTVVLPLTTSDPKVATYTIELRDLKYKNGNKIPYQIETSSIIVKPGVTAECLEQDDEECETCDIISPQTLRKMIKAK